MVSNKKRGLCKFNPRLFVSRRLLFRVVFFHVVEHILNVLIILKFFEKFFDLSALLFVYFFEIVGDAYKLCAFDFKLVFFEVFLNFRVAFKWCRKNDFVFFLVAVDSSTPKSMSSSSSSSMSIPSLATTGMYICVQKGRSKSLECRESRRVC